MGNWQELGQAIVLGLVFSFLVAKLISLVISFREDNLKIVRQVDPPLSTSAAAPEIEPSRPPQPPSPNAGESPRGELTKESLSDDEEDDDDSEWEGVESTELDEVFSAATTFVAASAADGRAAKVSSDKQLQLYGLYKIATEGPCTAPQPSALKMTARAKWNAWQKLGSTTPEDAMQKYIMIVDELYPSWADGSPMKRSAEDILASNSAAKGPMGPVFSSHVYEEESDVDIKLHPIHVCAREGRTDDILNHIASGTDVNSRDSEGRTPLHWAVDRGRTSVIEILLNKNADVNAKDHECQTPLHYAAICEREIIAELLVRNHADLTLKDSDGYSPSELTKAKWEFMKASNISCI